MNNRGEPKLHLGFVIRNAEAIRVIREILGYQFLSDLEYKGVI